MREQNRFHAYRAELHFVVIGVINPNLISSHRPAESRGDSLFSNFQGRDVTLSSNLLQNGESSFFGNGIHPSRAYSPSGLVC